MQEQGPNGRPGSEKARGKQGQDRGSHGNHKGNTGLDRVNGEDGLQGTLWAVEYVTFSRRLGTNLTIYHDLRHR